MKLPQFVANAPVRGTTGLPEYQPMGSGGMLAPYRALAQAGEAVEQFGQREFSIEARLAEQRARMEEASEALRLSTESELELKRARRLVERGGDYKTYVHDFQQQGQDVVKQALSKTKNANVRAALQERLSRRIGAETLAIEDAAEKRFMDTQVANLDQSLSNTRLLASQADSPDEMANYLGLGVGAVRAAVQGGLISAVEGGKRERDFLEDVSLELARKELDANPERFLEEAGQYTHIDPLKMQSLKEHAGKVAELRAAKEERARLRREREQEKAFTEQSLQTRTSLVQAMRAGRNVEAVASRMVQQRQLTDKDYQFILNYQDTLINRSYAAATRADAAEARRMGKLDAQLSIMAMTGAQPEEILAYARANKLPAPAFDGALDKAYAVQRQQHTQQGQTLTQAKEQLRSRFFAGAFDVLNTDAKKDAYANALDELTARSESFGGRENPMQIVDEVSKKYLALSVPGEAQELDKWEHQLLYQTAAELEADKASLPPWVYNEQKAIFKQIHAITKNLEKSAPKPKAGEPATDPRWFWDRWLGNPIKKPEQGMERAR